MLLPPVRYGEYQTGYTIGATVDITENHHLLCSVGGDIHGPDLFSYYVGYQWSWGAKTKEEKGVGEHLGQHPVK
jgi:hypothetical protein